MKGVIIAGSTGSRLYPLISDISMFSEAAKIFLKKVTNAQSFGVAELEGKRVTGIEEKSDKSKSNFAATGLYIYDHEVFDAIRTLRPSGRGELEITDVNKYYLKNYVMGYKVLDGFWSDAGTFESLFRISELVRT